MEVIALVARLKRPMIFILINTFRDKILNLYDCWWEGWDRRWRTVITCLLVEIKNIDHLKISSWLSFSTFPPTIKSCRMLELEENRIFLFLNYFLLYKAIRTLLEDIWPGGKIKGQRILPSHWRQSFGKTGRISFYLLAVMSCL